LLVTQLFAATETEYKISFFFKQFLSFQDCRIFGGAVHFYQAALVLIATRPLSLISKWFIQNLQHHLDTKMSNLFLNPFFPRLQDFWGHGVFLSSGIGPYSNSAIVPDLQVVYSKLAMSSRGQNV
jgi:hypothetical protein